jgi:3-hydroxyisobutyrate dehydrogenase
MGRGMVRNLVDKGCQVAVWNRTPAVAQTYFPSLSMPSSPAELAANVDVLVTCVADPAAVDRVVFSTDGVCTTARPGFTYVECSTIGPEQAERVAATLRVKGADMLAAPVTGSKLGAENGTLLFMTGGSAEVNARIEPVLLTMGERVIYCGSIGQAFVVKLVNNALVSFMLEGLCEGAVALSKAGIPLRTWLQVIQNSAMASKYYAFKGEALAKRDFSTHFSLGLLAKDQDLMLEQASTTLVSMPGLSAIREVFRSAQAQGYQAEDIAGVVRVLEGLAGPSGANGP